MGLNSREQLKIVSRFLIGADVNVTEVMTKVTVN